MVSGFQLSISVFTVFRKWKNTFDPVSYTGGSKGVGVVFGTGIPLLNIKTFTAWSSSYWLVGVGITMGSAGMSFGIARYWDITVQLRTLIMDIRSHISDIRGLLAYV